MQTCPNLMVNVFHSPGWRCMLPEGKEATGVYFPVLGYYGEKNSASFKKPVHGFGSVLYMELFIDIMDMLSDRTMADMQTISDLFI